MRDGLKSVKSDCNTSLIMFTLFISVVNFLGAMEDCPVSKCRFLDKIVDGLDGFCTIGLGIVNGFATGCSRRGV